MNVHRDAGIDADSSEIFLLNYQKGKVTKQVIGKNKTEKVLRDIAIYLKLSDAHLYTGHSFRRTSATTLLADSGGNMLLLQRHDGWASSNVAKRYVEESVGKKMPRK